MVYNRCDAGYAAGRDARGRDEAVQTERENRRREDYD